MAEGVEGGEETRTAALAAVRALAVTNQKGGSCKTTTTVNLAAALGETGLRVLVIDMDPQGSASAWLGAYDDQDHLLKAVTEGAKLKDAIRGSTAANVDVVPSTSTLHRAERTKDRKERQGNLREAVAGLPAKWDYLLMDCPPATGFLSTAALAACDEILVPVEAHVMALAGLTSLQEAVERVRNRANPKLAIAAILACRVNHTILARDVVTRLNEQFPGLVLNTCIRESVRLAEAPGFQKPITLYAPSSSGAEDYRAAARELHARPVATTAKPNVTKARKSGA